MANDTGKLGRDLPPGINPGGDLPVRDEMADMGYGVDADDLKLGYCGVEKPPPTDDNRAGEIAPPFSTRLPAQKGFLYRGMFPSDR